MNNTSPQCTQERLLTSAERPATYEAPAVIFEVTLEVRAGNEAAQRLYESMGFRMVAIRKKYYQDNQEDAHVMLKDLP